MVVGATWHHRSGDHRVPPRRSTCATWRCCAGSATGSIGSTPSRWTSRRSPGGAHVDQGTSAAVSSARLLASRRYAPYLMTRRIERAMSLLRRGDLGVTGSVSAVGTITVAGHLQSSRSLQAGRCAAQHLIGSELRLRDQADARLHGETGDQIRSGPRSKGPRSQPTKRDRHGRSPFTRASSHTTHPGRIPGLLPRHASASRVQDGIGPDRDAHGSEPAPAGPPRHVHQSCTAAADPRHSPADERRTIVE